LYPLDVVVVRIAAARAAIAPSSGDVILVGRSEGFLVGDTDLSSTVAPLVAYAAAGADCVYAAGVADSEAIKAIVAVVAPKPVNLLLTNRGMRVTDLAALGVRRVSTGRALGHAARSGLETAARMFRDGGTVPERR
jgi:2-methylisocitrate lyase-like PEP mutase family enzyme